MNRYDELLANLKAKKNELQELYDKINGHWDYEDGIYRFYHGSFKVFYLQGSTKEIVEMLKSLAPKGHSGELNEEFMQIIKEGTGKTFAIEMNARWLEETRPILEAFFHAKFMLEMALRYSKLEQAPNMLPSGWAALLYLYNMR